jgi:membrane associated rhomboid family serine protease
MAFSERQYSQKISLGQKNNALITLVAINLVFFVIFAFIKVLYFFRYSDNQAALAFYYENVLDWFTLPANGDKLLTRPWTIVTHMFLHDGVWHVLANMLWLGLFGFILQSLTGIRKLIPVFLYGGLAGALSFLLAFNFLPGLKSGLATSSLLGASAGVMAVAIVTTMLTPGYRIFPMIYGGIPLWVITVLFLIIDLATIPVNNAGGHIAHLAGALIGFLFMVCWRRGYDWSNWMNRAYEWFDNLFNPDIPRKGKHPRHQLFYKSSSSPYKKTPHITQQRIDEILDKINLKGYQSLTEEEKEMLERASKEDI